MNLRIHYWVGGKVYSRLASLLSDFGSGHGVMGIRLLLLFLL